MDNLPSDFKHKLETPGSADIDDMLDAIDQRWQSSTCRLQEASKGARANTFLSAELGAFTDDDGDGPFVDEDGPSFVDVVPSGDGDTGDQGGGEGEGGGEAGGSQGGGEGGGEGGGGEGGGEGGGGG